MNISLAQDADIELIQEFLNENWRRDYILAKNRAFFEWQFRSRHTRRVNFVIAKSGHGKIIGTLGFIPSDHHDHYQAEHPPLLWLTNWMVVRGKVPPGLGIMLRRFLENNVEHRGIGTIGLNRATLDLYRKFGFTTGEMDHHVLVNRNRDSFLLLGKQPKCTPIPDCDVQIRDLADELVDSLIDRLPCYLFKGPDYYRHRYLAHPVYRYRCLELRSGSNELLLFVRRLDAGGGSCLRIVEARGDFALLELGASALQDLMQHEDVEYIDFVSKYVADRSPFRNWEDGRSLEAPNYFEPYQPGFITLLFAVKMKPLQQMPFLFKGDCDQDAPRVVDCLRSANR